METKYYAITVDEHGQRHVRQIRPPKRRARRRIARCHAAVAAALLALLLLIALITGAGAGQGSIPSDEGQAAIPSPADQGPIPSPSAKPTAPASEARLPTVPAIGDRLITLEWTAQPPSEPAKQQAVAAAAAPVPEATDDCHIFSAVEIDMMAQTMFAEANVLSDRDFGVSVEARQAAVGWCILNRYDAGTFGDTLGAVIAAPAQFAWTPDAPVLEELRALAEDVCTRWWQERQGLADETTSGRTLPSRYIYFGGENGENWFRTEYDCWDDVWDWQCVDPY